MSDTARASFWARRGQALPWPCVFSSCVRDLWPAGGSRRNRTAAAEKAHVRYAGPIFAPEVPSSFPADAFAPWTRRQDARQSWTRGHRRLSWMSSRSTRRRLVPRPGTDGRREKVARGVRLGRAPDGHLHVVQQRVIVVKQCEGHLHTLLHGGITKPLGAPGTVGLLGELLPHLRQVVLTIGMVEVRQQCRPLAPERHSPPEQGTVARIAAGEPSAWGSIPPRRRAALLWESLLAFLALPRGWLAGRAPARAQRGGPLEDTGRRASTRSKDMRPPPPGHHERAQRP